MLLLRLICAENSSERPANRGMNYGFYNVLYASSHQAASSSCYLPVCVQLPTSADNVALPAFAAARLLLAAGRAAILLVGPTAANPQRRPIDGADKQTDGRTPGGCIDSAYYAGSTNKHGQIFSNFWLKCGSDREKTTRTKTKKNTNTI